MKKYYIYAIVREDLKMSTGKLAAQAGHAYTDALYDAHDNHQDRFEAYRVEGSKVSLKIENEEKLLELYEGFKSLGLPCALVTDSQHVIPGTAFDGSPIITAVGVGPIERHEIVELTGKLSTV